MNTTPFKTTLLVGCLFLSNCASNEDTRATLRNIDLSYVSIVKSNKEKIATKSEAEIKEAYYEYLKNADTNENTRQHAINRLAQMELELTNKLIKESDNQALEEDELYIASLNKTITLLTTSLKEFPKAKGNDVLLYQLARTYDQVGEYQKAILALTQLAHKYKKSAHYAEAQFRIGEAAFASGDYLSAEDAYTETIISADADRFYEKAFFKRGWTRYKQELYIEPVEDYIESLTLHRFPEYEQLKKNDKTLFDEYFRAIGLSFSHLSGAESLRNYFSSNSNFRYLFHTYGVISDIYLKQERFTDAADTLAQFVQHHGNAPEITKAQQNIINIWREAGFESKAHQAIEEYYNAYNPATAYWSGGTQTEFKKQSDNALKDYIMKEASYFHSVYQNSKKGKDYTEASRWYERYLSHYDSYARKDTVYSQYAELLYSNKRYEKALSLFALAAYDENIILDKRAAYMTITLTDMLYRKSESNQKAMLLEQLVSYTQRYIELYPNDENSIDIGVNAAQLAFQNKDYEQAILLSQAMPLNIPKKSRYKINIVTARSYFETNAFSEAESVYQSILDNSAFTQKQRSVVEENLALSIYRQAEIAKTKQDTALAIHHFTRIGRLTPNSDIAASALYDAIALAMQVESWSDAIGLINLFQATYPSHKFQNDVTKKLSVAYLKSNQGDKAAQEFERISSFEQDVEVKMAALWQAAELYENKGNTDGAIRSYRTYAHDYKKPLAQNMEAMNKLVELYKVQKQVQKRHFWLLKLASAGRRATEQEKNQRTDYLAATASLELAQQKHYEFDKVRLAAPLKRNLRKKKTLMQESIRLYGNASAFGLRDATTESTFAIGKIYQDFSIALLNSERPKELTSDELEQYEILLEDQAFPFEDKAIEFYETNIARSQTGLYNPWLVKSRLELSTLFPARYSRQGKTGGYLGSSTSEGK